jgi:nitrile hydratase accessory protein
VSVTILPNQPREANEPIFRAPWEAQAFAMAVTLHQQGLFTWPEWAEALAAQIASAQAAGDADLGDTYYEHWLAALEKLVARKAASSMEELTRYRSAWHRAAARTPHGQPIELQASDLAQDSNRNSLASR